MGQTNRSRSGYRSLVTMAALATVVALWADLAAAGQPPAETKPAGEEPAAPSLAEVVAKLDADFEKTRVQQKIVGMSVIIVHDQDVLLAKGYGYADLASNT